MKCASNAGLLESTRHSRHPHPHIHAHMHARTHARTHARARARTHTHTQTHNEYQPATGRNRQQILMQTRLPFFSAASLPDKKRARRSKITLAESMRLLTNPLQPWNERDLNDAFHTMSAKRDEDKEADSSAPEPSFSFRGLPGRLPSTGSMEDEPIYERMYERTSYSKPPPLETPVEIAPRRRALSHAEPVEAPGRGSPAQNREFAAAYSNPAVPHDPLFTVMRRTQSSESDDSNAGAWQMGHDSSADMPAPRHGESNSSSAGRRSDTAMADVEGASPAKLSFRAAAQSAVFMSRSDGARNVPADLEGPMQARHTKLSFKAAARSAFFISRCLFVRSCVRTCT